MSDFDLGQPTFDLLELRSFRRDTVLQYSLTNRVADLRILFLGSSAPVLAGLPWLATELNPGAGELAPLTVALSTMAGLACGLLTVRERAARGRRLRRLDRELSLGDLSIEQPSAAIGGGGRPTVASLRGRRRVVALCAPTAVLERSLEAAAIYRHRLAQSGVVLVAVPLGIDNAARGDIWPAVAREAEAEGWLWRPTDLNEWREYFRALIEDRRSTEGADDRGCWLALSLAGRSVGSSFGNPTWDELLGTQLQPLEAIPPDEGARAGGLAEGGVLVAQAQLYKALAAADAEAVARLFAAADDAEVSELAAGGRLDGWPTVLQYDATVGLRVASQDARIAEGGRVAYSTGLEFPKSGGTLLSTQRWIDANFGGEGGADWQLVQHRTIPYSMAVDAAACLRCDHRGCVALQRTGGG